MKLAARIAGVVALAATVVPSCVYLAGGMDLETVKTVMLVGTVLWFIAAPIADRQTRGEEIVEESGQVVVP